MYPKLTLIFSIAFFVIAACNSKNSKSTVPFCTAGCMQDSLKFTDSLNKLKPYVYISARNCSGDTLTWGFTGRNKNIAFNYKLNKDYVRCYFRDTASALLVFNTCETGRGYFFKFFFGKKGSFRKSSGAINNFDPRFAVASGLLAYTDKGNIFVEEIASGKQDLMTFGQPLDFDFDAIHETLDSVNITATHAWARVKINGVWKVLEKDIALKQQGTD